MEKFKYTAEFEIHASTKMIYPYLSSATGLQEWLADEVNVKDSKTMDIIWDDQSHLAKVVSKRTNHHIKYQFLSEENGENSEERQSSLEFKIDYNEMTQTSFLKVIDFSEMDDEDDLRELWEQLIGHLREKLGG